MKVKRKIKTALTCLASFYLALTACSPSTPQNEKGGSPARTASQKVPATDLSALGESVKQRIMAAQAEVEKDQSSADGWGKLGQAYQVAEYREAAVQCYGEAARLDPLSGKWLYLLSLIQLQDTPDTGLTNLVRAVSLLSSTNDAPRLQLGKAMAERGYLPEAANQFSQILAAAPGHPAARLELARLHLRSNNIAAAEELLRPCVTNSFTAKPALLLLSQLRSRSGQAAEATAIAQRAASMPKPFDWPDPFLREVQSLQADDQKTLERVNGLLMQGRFPDAENLLKQLHARSPQDPETVLLLGRLRLQQKKCDEAENYFQQHLTLSTNSLQGWVQLGLARFCQSRWDQAAVAFEKATELKPDFAQAHYNLGLALSRARKSAPAIAAYQNALRAQPGDPASHAALAEEFLSMGNRAEAAAQAEEALRIDPRQPKALRIKQMLQQIAQ